jgi:DNA replication protein DnaC
LLRLAELELPLPLVHELIEARDDKRLLRLQRQLAAYKLLIIDELGYVPLLTTGAELLFEVFSQRHERGSTIVTSNLRSTKDDRVRSTALASPPPVTRVTSMTDQVVP